ncbi:MAG: T9SS type A sorting domain-containing protein [Phaeodactylibacter sp.]|nr:T9SS type A sorting domain-containing protein [Phaeodactylibacter sp.]
MKSILLALFGVCFTYSLFATHNFGGEIIFRQIDPLTVEAEGHIYHKLSSVQADRDTLMLCWGDGTCDQLLRTNGPDLNGNGIPDGEIIPGTDAKLSIYRSVHIYEAQGTYKLSITDPNRNGGLLNVNFPNSDQVRFHVQSLVNVTDDDTPNHSPVNYEPIVVDNAMVDRLFQHTPNAFDQDGDSIVYQLITPMQDLDLDVPNYGDPFSSVSVDPVTGVFNFESPRAGEYSFAIAISTYRDGVLQDLVVRDMLVFCSPGTLMPPVLSLSTVDTDQEVMVGDTVSIDAAALSTPFGAPIHLTCTGGLFEYFGAPATFDALGAAPSINGTFQWIVEEEDRRTAPYQIVFKARDDGNQYGLSTLIPIRFKVVTQLTSAEELINRKHLRIFPNPAGQFVQLSGLEVTEPVDFQIRSASGQLLRSGSLQSSVSQVDVESLPKGWYLFTVRFSEGGYWQEPFVKQ